VSSNSSASRLELTLLAVVLLAAACGGHAQPRVVGHYLLYSLGYDTAAGPSIVLTRADGSGARTIAHGQDAVLSPDGRWVAFDVEVPRARGSIYKLFVVSTRGSKPRPLGLIDSWPTWSPSDRIWTFKGKDLVSIDLRGHMTVLDRDSGITDWSFSPDGQSIVFSAGSGLTVMRATGVDRHSLTHGADDGDAVWGTHWIAFGRAWGGIWRIRPDGTGLQRLLAGPRQPGRYGIWGYVPVAWAPDEKTLLARVVTPHAWDVGIRIDVATGRFTYVHGYPVGLSRDGQFALAFGGRPTGGPDSGLEIPEKIWALPFGDTGRRRVLARGDVCCPSWNR
jgi:Tol biopolymer transport system component